MSEQQEQIDINEQVKAQTKIKSDPLKQCSVFVSDQLMIQA